MKNLSPKGITYGEKEIEYDFKHHSEAADGESVVLNASMPKVSVVMATYNDNPGNLRIAIESILNQTYKNIELIIVDDSTDIETVSVIDDYAYDTRVKIMREEERAGFASSLNKGLEAATGDFIARMDGDDQALPRRFEKQIKYFTEHPKTDDLGTYLNIIDQNGDITGGREYPLKGTKLALYFMVRSPLAHPTVMFRREIVDEGFRYDEDLKRAEDIDLWLKLYNNKYIIENLPEKLVNYRVDEGFIEKRVSNKEQENYVIMIRRKNVSYKRPFFSVASYIMTFVRKIVSDGFKQKRYNKENYSSNKETVLYGGKR